MTNKDWLTLGMALAGATAGGFAGRKYDVEETDRKTGKKTKKKEGLGVIPGAILGGWLAAKGGNALGDRIFDEAPPPAPQSIQDKVNNAAETARQEAIEAARQEADRRHEAAKKQDAAKQKKTTDIISDDARSITRLFYNPLKPFGFMPSFKVKDKKHD